VSTPAGTFSTNIENFARTRQIYNIGSEQWLRTATSTYNPEEAAEVQIDISILSAFLLVCTAG